MFSKALVSINVNGLRFASPQIAPIAKIDDLCKDWLVYQQKLNFVKVFVDVRLSETVSE